LANSRIYGDTTFVRKVHPKLCGNIGGIKSADLSRIHGWIQFSGVISGPTKAITGHIWGLRGEVQPDADGEPALWGDASEIHEAYCNGLTGYLGNKRGHIRGWGRLSEDLRGDLSGLPIDLTNLTGDATGIVCRLPWHACLNLCLAGNFDEVLADYTQEDRARPGGIDIQNLTALWT
jgi:hypothetical protein